jgi:hypothetical protein
MWAVVGSGRPLYITLKFCMAIGLNTPNFVEMTKIDIDNQFSACSQNTTVFSGVGRCLCLGGKLHSLVTGTPTSQTFCKILGAAAPLLPIPLVLACFSKLISYIFFAFNLSSQWQIQILAWILGKFNHHDIPLHHFLHVTPKISFLLFLSISIICKVDTPPPTNYLNSYINPAWRRRLGKLVYRACENSMGEWGTLYRFEGSGREFFNPLLSITNHV